MDVLVIDNYDSFTFNLVQLAGSILGTAPRVVRNDEIDGDELRRLRPDAVIVSPGAGHPARTRDFGVSRDAVVDAGVPLLGVCLGHQGLAHHFGADIRQAPAPMHGRTCRIDHDRSELFSGIPQGFVAVRYHSLAVCQPLPEALSLTAWAGDGVPMGIRHRTLPLWGVQFHPESIGTAYGSRLIRNFLDLATTWKRSAPAATGSSFPAAAPPPGARSRADRGRSSIAPRALRVRTRVLPFLPDTESVFVTLFGADDPAFWLDSSLYQPGLSRFSYMGGAGGPRSRVVSYDAPQRTAVVDGPSGSGRVTGGFFDLLDAELAGEAPLTDDDLPFGFTGGFVGYLGYELKGDNGLSAVHRSPYSDAWLLFVDRMLVFDHHDRCLYLVALTDADDAESSERWFDQTQARVESAHPAPPPLVGTSPGPLTLSLRRDEAGYLADILRCQDEIRWGESYEICLTNMISTAPVSRPLDLYRILRATSPAPYAAYLRLGATSVLCSSPERFLRITAAGEVTSKPIKGTAGRSPVAADDRRARRDLDSSVKDRSEHLMIVDLLRNDLGRVCELGSVHVPTMMEVESFATVHQLVTTIAGRLRPGLSAVDCLRSAFPGGSMTGAPKARTVEILDRLERGPRGVYSGAIGWLGLDGAAELNVVIRTAVATPDGTSMGVGGAIVALSDPHHELDETLLKAAALIRSLGVLGNGSFRPDDVRIEGTRISADRSALLLAAAPSRRYRSEDGAASDAKVTRAPEPSPSRPTVGGRQCDGTFG